jgi:UDP-N-acetylmuramoyl-tripeptide--D-alanyl-D-alanine ligase
MRSPIDLQRLGLRLWHVKIGVMYAAAYAWRRILFRTTFIAITGSMGKTTARQCLAAALSSRFRTVQNVANQNDYAGVPRTILRVRPWHRFAVIEVAAGRAGLMKRGARLVRPDIAVVLTVARSHMRNFRTLDSVAVEKSQLVGALRSGGTAVLNGDDPHVAQMADSAKHRIVLFGTSAACTFRADSLSSRWPERFSFRFHAGGESLNVQTRLVGNHWKDSVLGALAAAQVCGVPLAEAVEAISSVDPTTGRMEPAKLPCGATMIRDDFNGSTDTLRHALKAIADASASRKVLVISDVTDNSNSPRDRLKKIGREAAATVDLVVFIGDRAAYGVEGAVSAGMQPRSAHGAPDWQSAAGLLKAQLRDGDLVLLRGRGNEHLGRIYFSQLGTVRCPKPRCDKMILCELCPELGFKPDTPPRGGTQASSTGVSSRNE